MKSFKHYLLESNREYHYRIKTVVEMNDDRLDRVERLLQKYNLMDISNPKKTLMQRHPLDFQDLDHAEVWIVDVVTGLPVSAYILQQEIRTVLEISETFVIVRTDNDPLEVETEMRNAIDDINDQGKKLGLDKNTLMNTTGYLDSEMGLDGKTFYGDEYNNKLRDYLANISATRKPEVKSSPLFDFVKGNEKPENADANDFNKDIKDAPKSVPWWERMSDIDFNDVEKKVSPEGNFDDDFRTYSRTFKDKDGKPKAISVDTDSIRSTKKNGRK